MEIVAAIFTGIYCIGLLIYTIAWQRCRSTPCQPGFLERLSVVVPVRNEEENIYHLLKDLEHQHYPKENYEVIVVDDSSEDRTVDEVRRFLKESTINIRLVREINGQAYPTPKKKAITRGVMESNGDVIVTTDGDCRLGSGWLDSIARPFYDEKSNFVSGPVVFDEGSNFFEKIQLMEFASLIGVGASSIELGFPNICNGANLAFRKKNFLSLNGYNGNGHIASGDDEFLLQKFAAVDPKGIRFVKEAGAVVRTLPKKTLKEFYHQRKRWTSKLRHHKEQHIRAFSLGIFLFNLFIVVSFFSSLAGWFEWPWFIALFLSKCTFEVLFLSQVLRFFRRPMDWPGLIFLELIHPFYIILFGVFSNFGSFNWKGRTYYE